MFLKPQIPENPTVIRRDSNPSPSLAATRRRPAPATTQSRPSRLQRLCAAPYPQSVPEPSPWSSWAASSSPRS